MILASSFHYRFFLPLNTNEAVYIQLSQPSNDPHAPTYALTSVKMDAGARVLEERRVDDVPTDDHLLNLKALTEKLRLETRRPSYLEWKAQVEAASFGETRTSRALVQVDPVGGPQETAGDSDQFRCNLSSGLQKTFGTMDDALGWLRRELVRQSLCSVCPNNRLWICISVILP